MARPKITEMRKRHSIRFHDEDWLTIKERADRASVSPSEFIRRAAMQKRIPSKVNLKAINELKRLGGLQKLSLKEIGNGAELQGLRFKLNETLEAILKTIKRLDSLDQEV